MSFPTHHDVPCSYPHAVMSKPSHIRGWYDVIQMCLKEANAKITVSTQIVTTVSCRPSCVKCLLTSY